MKLSTKLNPHHSEIMYRSGYTIASISHSTTC